MTNNDTHLQSKAFRCPNCKRDLPEELSFCPYCMERIKKATVITQPSQNKNKKHILIIAVFIGLFVTSLLCLIGILWASKGQGNTNTIDRTTPGITASNTQTGNKTNTEQLNDITENTHPLNTTANQNSNLNEHTDAPYEQNTTKPFETQNQTTQPNISDNAITIEQLVGRWNKANADLSIYNFQLSGYNSQNHGDSYTISQSFNNNGVNMNFKFNKNLETFTLNADNVLNLNSMYQLCRVTLGSVADYDYNDGAFYDFLSSDNWEKTDNNTETKTGNFAGYNCKLTLVTHENTDQWGMTYSRYSFTLAATKL